MGSNKGKCMLLMKDDMSFPLNRDGNFNPDGPTVFFSSQQAEAVARLVSSTTGIELLVAEE
jgi:hypothetical protein